MRHIIFKESNTYPIGILVKNSAMNKDSLIKNYIIPLENQGINRDQIIVYSLEYQKNGKAPVSLVKTYMQDLLPHLEEFNTTTLYVTDANYFKPLTGCKKMAPFYGYSMPGKLPGFENFKIVAGIAYPAIYHNPSLNEAKDLTLSALADIIKGQYRDPGQGIIHYSEYPSKLSEIKTFLSKLHDYPALTCDIETFSLKPETAGIGTIAFAWNKHEGGAFCVDYQPIEPATGIYFGNNTVNIPVRNLLKEFFEAYKGKLIFHGITFDAKMLVRHLFMSAPEDYKNQMIGTELLTKNALCTQILVYLATNNCVSNKLDLKSNAQEFCGNWAQDEIKDIRKIPYTELLQYNLVDCLATWFVHDKYLPTVIEDKQDKLYETMYYPSIPVIINAELNGMPMNPVVIKRNSNKLADIITRHSTNLAMSPLIQDFNESLQYDAMVAKNILLKTRQDPIEKFSHIKFNPNSSSQIADLLYTHWDFPVNARTATGEPSTKASVLKGLLLALMREHNITETAIERTIPSAILEVEQARILHSLIELNKAKKIQGTFFKAFKEGVTRKDGMSYLQGNFNLTGTKSGRLSSSDPNLQNLPSTGTVYAKLCKECFEAPEGWIMVGADFDSLEDRISALTTKDPSKLKVYEEGYDGHSLRAYSYFGNLMPDIDPSSVTSINSIGDKYPTLRQDSKGPTFALTYGGTSHALVEQCGFTQAEAVEIESKYHELYSVSDAWVADRITQASKDGYVETAFGLRLRTPLLARTDLNKSYTPYEAQKEARTAGNALGQSYCLLNNRAAVDFMNRVNNSDYKYDIKLICLIHDAIYLLIRDNPDVLHWVNQNLPDCMSWQNLPEIQHDKVKLSGSVDVFYPNWAHSFTLDKQATKEEIILKCSQATQED